MGLSEIIDRAIRPFAPGVALRRLQLRTSLDLASDSFNDGNGYEGASTSRWRDSFWLSRSKPQDEDHHIGTRAKSNLRLQHRDLRRNFGMVAGYLQRFSRNILWGGIHAEFETDSDEFNDEAEDFMKDWQRTCDVRGRDDLEGISRKIIEARPLDGDGVVVKLKDGRIQPIEGERITSPFGIVDPRMVDGKVVDPSGVLLGVYVCGRLPNGAVDRTKFEYVRAADLILWANRWRIDQVGGTPDLAPMANDLEDFRKLQLYTVNRAKQDQMNGWGVFTKDGGIPSNLVARHQAAGKSADEPVIQDAGGLRFWWMRRGDDLKSLKSETPNATYEPFAGLIMRLLAAGFGVPYEFFALDFRNLSFSTAAAIVQEAGNTALDWHRWLGKDVLDKLTWWRIAMAIRDKDIRPAPIDKRTGVSQAFKVRWAVPQYQWIEEQKYIDAQKAGWNMSITSLDEIARKKGKTRSDLLEAKANDIRAAIVLAQKLSEDLKVPVSWDQLINAQIPGVTSLVQQATETRTTP